MLLYNRVCEILENVQICSGSHQQHIQILSKLYKKSSEEEYFEAFIKCIKIIFERGLNRKDIYAHRSLKFLGGLAMKIHQLVTKEADHSQHDETLFLYKIIKAVLKFHLSQDHKYRLGSCMIVSLLLDDLNDDIHFNESVYDTIQEAMLAALKDNKVSVRVAAVAALHRLQNPTKNDCPVLKAFGNHMLDSSALVRREIVHKIAPCTASIPKIVVKVNDIDHRVRQVAFYKCSLIKPSYLKIVDRQGVLLSGFREQNQSVKKMFLDVLLPKWLSAYEGNFLNLLTAIKLDADENDVETSAMLSNDIMQAFFKRYPIQDIIGCLPIDENKLLPIEKLSNETISYWSLLHRYLRKCDTDDSLDAIVPELSIFCDYIQRVIKEKYKSDFENWQLLEYQFVLMKLFEMAGSFDLSDEVGRQTLHTLVLNTIIEQKLDIKIIEKMMEILDTLSANSACLIGEVSNLIYNIREPPVEDKSIEDLTKENSMAISKLKARINALLEDVERAIKVRDLKLASLKDGQLKSLQMQLAGMQNGSYLPDEEKPAKKVLDDVYTICRCLDLLITMLSLPSIKELNTNLKECKNDLLPGLEGSNSMEIYRRVFKVTVLCAIIDKTTAAESLKLIFTPVYTYRVLPEGSDPEIVLNSIKGITDLLRIYGSNLFKSSEIENHQQSKKRRLYQSGDAPDGLELDFDEIFAEDVIDMLLYLQDDESSDIRECAGTAIGHILYDAIMITPALLSKIFLKWCNPLMLKSNPKVQQVLGMALFHYAKQEGSADVINKAVIPTLRAIHNAPKTSPLADVNLENVIEILALLTSCKREDDNGEDIHKSLAVNLCKEMRNHPLDKIVIIWVKMLIALRIPYEDAAVVKELRIHIEAILEDIIDKFSIQKLRKFKTTLEINQECDETESTSTETVQNTEDASRTQCLEDIDTNRDELRDNNKRKAATRNGLTKKVKIVPKESQKDCKEKSPPVGNGAGKKTKCVSDLRNGDRTKNGAVKKIKFKSKEIDLIEDVIVEKDILKRKEDCNIVASKVKPVDNRKANKVIKKVRRSSRKCIKKMFFDEQDKDEINRTRRSRSVKRRSKNNEISVSAKSKSITKTIVVDRPITRMSARTRRR